MMEKKKSILAVLHLQAALDLSLKALSVFRRTWASYFHAFESQNWTCFPFFLLLLLLGFHNTLHLSQQQAFDFPREKWEADVAIMAWIHYVASLFSRERYSLRQPSNDCRILGTAGIHLLIRSTLFTTPLPLSRMMPGC